MYTKRLLSLLIALLMVFSMTTTLAETPAKRTVEYVGGVVFRTLPRDDPDAELINVAYIRCDAAYPVVGNSYDYSLMLSGGVAPYTCIVDVWVQELDAGTLSYDYYTTPEVDENYCFTVEYNEEMRYFISVDVTDSQGQMLYFQGRPFETFTPSQESDATTVAGKVNQIVNQYITPDMSDYTRARVLHDWLIFNADYDTTYTYYDANGVLLLGTGVCDSYSKAYQLLLTAAGIESTIVTGTAGGSHAWNLVKLGGSWYHIDCTWDDPTGGGAENWSYFCLTDEQMAKDHQWNRENTDALVDQSGMISPEATDTTYAQSDASVDYDFSFTEISELTNGFNTTVAPVRKGTMMAKYLGTAGSGIYGDFGNWVNEMNQQYSTHPDWYFSRYGYFSRAGVYYYYADVEWTNPLPYLRIDETNLRTSIGDIVELTIAEEAEDMAGVTWSSDNPAVATVRDGIVTCLAAGTANISAVHDGRTLDTVIVIVLEAYAPDFDFALTQGNSGVTLTWNSIPGVTEYRIFKVIGGKTSAIATVTDTTATLTNAQLSSSVIQEVYVLGVRKVSGTDQLSYESEHLSYGRLTITYTSVLPEDTVNIAAEAFLNNTSLTTVDMPSGVTTIGERSFKGCSDLSAVRIPSSVTSIADSAFEGCSALEYAEVPTGSYAETWFRQKHPEVTIIH